MTIKELKKELSELSGINFFSPKYRDVFNKFAPNDNSKENANELEEDKLKEILGEEKEEAPKPEEEPLSLDDTAKPEEESKEEEIETTNKDTAIAEEDPKTEEADTKDSDNSETPKTAEEPENSETTDASKEDQKANQENNLTNELLEAKVELQLVKSGVREDRLEPAKKLFMQDIKTLQDLDKLKDLVKQYPEWLKTSKPETKPFGMSLGDNEGVLTAEQKRLKAMGIDPHN